MNKVCEVCEKNSAYAVCDECGKSVCFNCFQFQNHLKLCNPCLLQPRASRRSGRSGQTHSKPGPERTKLALHLADVPQLQNAEQDPGGETHRKAKFLRHSWLVVPIFCAVIIVFVYFDQTISRKAVEAGKKLESGVNTVADSVEREVAQLSPVLNKTRVLKPAEEVAAVKLLVQHLRKQERFSVSPTSLRSAKNPRGDGLILYLAEPAPGSARAVWIVLDGQAYTLTDAAREVTPNLSTAQEAPTSLWTRTGLQRDTALTQLRSVLAE